MKKANAIAAFKHFTNNEHTFSKHGKFIVIEQLRNTRENFWIKKLKTLTPYGLNQKLY